MCLLVTAHAGANTDVEFHRDVMPIVHAKCLACHSENGVSFSYENPDEAYVFRAAIASSVKDNRMPPWLAEPGHQTYVDDYSLSAEEKAVIAEWAAAGYPRDDAAAQPVKTVQSRVVDADIVLDVQGGESYLPDQTRKDDYRCFIVDWPYESDKYVTGFEARPGNLRIAHHVVVYSVRPEAAGILKTLSAEEDGFGYQCFGGPLPDRLGSKDEQAKLEERFPGGLEKLNRNNFWLSHWAPGTKGLGFPEDTGILMEPGSIIVVQMHYYSAYAPGETDTDTTLYYNVADHVEKPSIFLPLSKGRWLNGRENGSMAIEAGETETYETRWNFERVRNYAAHALRVDPESVAAVELQSANVHMHAFGAAGSTSLLRSSGRKETLLKIPRWDLNWQRDFMFAEGKVVPRDEFAGTQLIVECTFSNYTDDTVYGGYGSYDEMCFNFSYVSLIRGEPQRAARNERSTQLR